MNGEAVPADDGAPYARLVANLAAHRDATLRNWLAAHGQIEASTLQEVLAEQAGRRAGGQPVLLEELLLQRRLLAEHDLAAAFPGEVAPSDGPRYEIVDRLGEGSGGVVYRARDRLLDRIVAIKVLKAACVADDARPFVEGASLARLRHPNLVTVFDAGMLDGQPFVATEWIDGTTLATVLAQRTMNLRQLVQCAAEVARGLGAAHRLGIVHRDVKPANVLVDGLGRVRVCDFGLARPIGDDGARRGGTPHFMAPEQFAADTAAITPATDVYGLGALLYQVLVGVPPFASVDAAALGNVVQRHDPVPPHVLSRVPRELSAVAMRALSRAPHERYRDGDDFAAELEAWLQGAPVRARAASLPVRTARIVRRHPVRVALAFAGVVGVAAAVGLLWGGHERATLRRQLSDRMQQAAELGLDAVARLRRAGDMSGMAALAGPVEAACHAVLAQFPDEGRPHYVLACLYRTTMQCERARVHVDQAAARLPDDPDVRFERGMLGLHFALLAQQRQREQAQREELWRGAAGWARARFRALYSDLDAIDRAAVEAAAADLRASQRPGAVRLAAALAGPGLFAGFDQAPADLTADLEAEAYAWLAAAAMLRADFAVARTFATVGHERDRGYGRHLLLRATAALRAFTVGDRDASTLHSVQVEVDRDLKAALALQPDDADLHERCALVWLLLHDEAATLRVEVPGGTLERAVAALAQAAAVDAGVAERWHGLAISRLELLQRRGLRTAGADERLAAAHADLDRALALDSERAAFHESRGHLFLCAQRRLRGSGRAGPDHAAAMSAFERAATLAPRHIGPQLGQALSLQLAGKREVAIEVLERAAAELPASAAMVAPMLARLRR